MVIKWIPEKLTFLKKIEKKKNDNPLAMFPKIFLYKTGSTVQMLFNRWPGNAHLFRDLAKLHAFLRS